MLDSTSFFQSPVFPQLWKSCGFSGRYGVLSPMNLWKQVLDRLEQVVDRTDYETWFAPTRFAAQKGDTLDVVVPSQRYVDEIRERYAAQLRSILDEVAGERLNLHLIVNSIGVPLEAPPPPPTDLPHSVFNPKYRFGSFVVGNSNQLAYAASMSIAENPS